MAKCYRATAARGWHATSEAHITHTHTHTHTHWVIAAHMITHFHIKKNVFSETYFSSFRATQTCCSSQNNNCEDEFSQITFTYFRNKGMESLPWCGTSDHTQRKVLLPKSSLLLLRWLHWVPKHAKLSTLSQGILLKFLASNKTRHKWDRENIEL